MSSELKVDAAFRHPALAQSLVLCAVFLFQCHLFLNFIVYMALHLSYTQKEIFNLIHELKSEDELKEIKSLLIAYFSDKVIREADKAFDENEYATEIFEKWKIEHFRKQF